MNHTVNIVVNRLYQRVGVSVYLIGVNGHAAGERKPSVVVKVDTDKVVFYLYHHQRHLVDKLLTAFHHTGDTACADVKGFERKTKL